MTTDHKPRRFLWALTVLNAVFLNIHLNTAARPECLTNRHASLATYIREATGTRAIHVSELFGIMNRVKGPLILAGDFNTPPRGHIYGLFADNFQDSFRASGWGFGYSFHSDLPVMRIDHIFVRKGLRPINCFVPPLAGSDHRPVVADIAFDR